jgi:hypothetical protein
MTATKGFIVELEDLGQDFLQFTTDNEGVIITAEPFRTDLWKGGIIPINQQEIGDLCMMHKPPNIVFGFLKYKVISIKPLRDDSN